MDIQYEHRLTALEQQGIRTESRLNKLEKLADIEHRLTATEDRGKSNTRRIEKMENLTEEIHKMANAMVRLTEQSQETNKSVEELKDKVESLENAPVENYKHIKKTIITSIITGVLGAVIGALISLIIKGS